MSGLRLYVATRQCYELLSPHGTPGTPPPSEHDRPHCRVSPVDGTGVMARVVPRVYGWVGEYMAGRYQVGMCTGPDLALPDTVPSSGLALPDTVPSLGLALYWS